MPYPPLSRPGKLRPSSAAGSGIGCARGLSTGAPPPSLAEWRIGCAAGGHSAGRADAGTDRRREVAARRRSCSTSSRTGADGSARRHRSADRSARGRCALQSVPPQGLSQERQSGTIKGNIVRLHLIEELLAKGAEFPEIDPKIIRQLGELGRRYDAGDLRRFAKQKRDALVACYLIETRKTLLDQIVEMNDQFLTGMNRRAENTVKAKERVLHRRARAGMDRVLGGIDALAAADGNQTVHAFREANDAPGLVEAAAACRAFHRLEERGQLDALLARYGTLRQYLPAFVALPFQAAVGSEKVMAAITILRELDAGTRERVNPDDPHGFVPAAWRPLLVEKGKVERRVWEISLAFAIRDALRAGNLFLAESREHVSFWNLVYDERHGWRRARRPMAGSICRPSRTLSSTTLSPRSTRPRVPPRAGCPQTASPL